MWIKPDNSINTYLDGEWKSVILPNSLTSYTIIDGDASGSGALTEYDKLVAAINNGQLLFVKIQDSSYKTHILPLRWAEGTDGSYYLYFELPRIGENGVVTGYISYKREIVKTEDASSGTQGGWVESAWVTRESLCAVPITQAEYDALETKEDVFYVIKE